MSSPDRDPEERPDRALGEAKGRSVVIPLDGEDAMRELARFSYSGEGDAEAQGTTTAARRGERR